jgi:hypothetical protein
MLADSARPYGFAVDAGPELLPDLVFHSPESGVEVARFRYFEQPGQSPFLQTIIPPYVSATEQKAVEQHLAAHVAPVIVRELSYAAWLKLAED